MKRSSKKTNVFFAKISVYVQNNFSYLHDDSKYEFCVYLMVKLGSVVWALELATDTNFLKPIFLGSRNPKMDISNENSEQFLYYIYTFSIDTIVFVRQ